jgi:hypothetical protein
MLNMNQDTFSVTCINPGSNIDFINLHIYYSTLFFINLSIFAFVTTKSLESDLLKFSSLFIYVDFKNDF